MGDGVSASAPILRLPLELLVSIAAGLTTPELCALRLTCRLVEELLYVTFTSEFFTKKQFMITDVSLQALIDISRSRLGLNLRHLHIGLDRFPDRLRQPLADDDRHRKFRQRYSDYLILWDTGTHRTMLTEALRNLSNLEEIVIRDFNSHKRTRDGPNAEWTSYGANTIFNETGVRLKQGGSIPGRGCSQTFAVVLLALGDAAVCPKGIQVMSHNRNRLWDYAFHIPRFMEPSVAPVLDKLEKLHLSIDLSWMSSLSESANDALVTGRPQSDTHSDTQLLRRFLRRTPNLKDLRINERWDQNPSLSDFLEWLAAPAPSQDYASSAGDEGDKMTPPPVALSHLEHLSLGCMIVGPQTLLQVIRKFAPHLQGLELWKISLHRSLPPGSDPNDPPRSNFWVDFMNQLKQVAWADFRHFKAGMLKQTYTHGREDYFVSFKKRGPVVEYTGPCWKDFFDEVTPLLDVTWRRPRSVTPESDVAVSPY